MDRDVLYQVGRYNTADHDLPRLDRAEFPLRAMASSQFNMDHTRRS